MAGFMDELRDCLANGWTVELGELGYFTPSLNCRREAMEKKELRSASVTLRGLNFRLGKEFYNELNEKFIWSVVRSRQPPLLWLYLRKNVSACLKRT